MIEIKINNEIRSVKADVMAGISLYELFFCFLAVAAATATGGFLYFRCGALLTVSAYAAVAVAVPFAFAGFFKWHEMNGIAVIKKLISMMKDKKTTTYGSKNEVHIAIKKAREKERKTEKKEEIKDAIKHITQRLKRKGKKAAQD